MGVALVNCRFSRLAPLRSAVLVCAGVGTLVVTPVRAAGGEIDVGVKSWTTERFGSDVAVLRSDDTAKDPEDRIARLLLSCVGADRRFRLSIPNVISTTEAGGSAVIATPDSADATRLIARFKLADSSTILITPGRSWSPDVAVAIGRMLLTKPRALDLILSLGPNPVAFTKLKVIRVLLSLKPESVDAVARFVGACGRSPAARNN